MNLQAQGCGCHASRPTVVSSRSMIARPTVFILGAGASVPYGFPAGAQLLHAARSLDLINLAAKLHVPSSMIDEIHALHVALSRTHDASLDALLELRPDIVALGKRLIASLMLEIEYNAALRPFPEQKDDWLTTFFGELAADTKTVDEFAAGGVSVITYNYDRVFEHRLSGAIAAHYGPAADYMGATRKIPIIHLHGSLGPLPAFAAMRRTISKDWRSNGGRGGCTATCMA